MKPAPFEYKAPTSLEEALECLEQHGYDAKALAGGQSLIPSMNFRLIQPAVLVDLNEIAGLDSIERKESGGLHIGALARQRAVERSALVAETVPLLSEAMPFVAHPQIRNRGTLGGSIAHADPAAEISVVAVALNATMHIASRAGKRSVPATDFFQGIFTVDLEPEELLVGVEFPAPIPNSGYAFMEFARRHGDFALAGVAAIIQLDGEQNCTYARLVLLNLGERPVVASAAAAMLTGSRVDRQKIEAAAAHAASEEIDPVGNVHATARYQRHLAEVLTRRAIQKALERASGD